jgi:hypothetical protein
MGWMLIEASFVVTSRFCLLAWAAAGWCVLASRTMSSGPFVCLPRDLAAALSGDFIFLRCFSCRSTPLFGGCAAGMYSGSIQEVLLYITIAHRSTVSPKFVLFVPFHFPPQLFRRG